jgi:hypothetical protein
MQLMEPWQPAHADVAWLFQPRCRGDPPLIIGGLERPRQPEVAGPGTTPLVVVPG